MAACSHVLEDGNCADGYRALTLYSRVPGWASEAGKQALRQVARDACLSEDDFKLTSVNGQKLNTALTTSSIVMIILVNF